MNAPANQLNATAGPSSNGVASNSFSIPPPSTPLPRPIFATSPNAHNGLFASPNVQNQAAAWNAIASQMSATQNPISNTNLNGSASGEPIIQVKADSDGEDELDESDDGNVSESSDSFKIRDGVPPPRQMSYTTKELHASIHQGDIDLEPPYQRDVVWPNAKQVKLVDSLFRNFYIPPIVFAQSEDEDGNITKVCVDGKQRLTSIQKFMDGHIARELPVSSRTWSKNMPSTDRDVVTKKNWWYTCLGQSTAKSQQLEIPMKYKQMFDNIKIHCIEYQVLGQEMEREIFQRVQLGVALTAAEKLQAISSPWGAWISSLESKHVHIENGLRELFQWDVARGRDFQNIVHLIYCCDKLENEDRQELPTASKIDVWLRRTDEPDPRFQKRINDVLDFMTYLAGRDARRDGLVNGFMAVGKRVAPVEFVFIGVLLFVMAHASKDDRARAVLDLRKNVRSKHKDVRMNTNCVKTIWTFIMNIQEGLSSAEDSETPSPRSCSKRRKGKGKGKGKAVNGSGNRSLKRGRESEDDFDEADADGEDDPSYKPVSKTSRGRKVNKPRK
ncbi:hypothetical protein BDN71DRAFT_1591415 [Pleurotus eryngii]|uniref:GmrSD restriction endonucleases N-terminal domain-containing protein n=1 Tax=Pleurotus eryngii TaxID=5323 RepID=A0A9P5ZSB6_PLEER|nr:hypothetical protein BDN71DRAFT_1591415 [Pleurotus eryngii]